MAAPQETLADVVRAVARSHPRRIATLFQDEQVTYAELVDKVDDMAAVLRAAGVRPGDRIAHFGHSNPDYLTTLLAAATVGAVWVGLNPKYSAREIRYVLEDSEPVVVLAASSVAESDDGLAEALQDGEYGVRISLSGDRPHWIPLEACDRLRTSPEVREQADTAALVYTSGTTGAPKGALIRHSSLLHAGRVYASQYPPLRAETPRTLCNLPINHVGCLCDITAATICGGGSIVFMERFEPDAIPSEIDAKTITVVGQVPTMWRYILALPTFEAADLSSLEWTVWSGAPMAADLAQHLRDKGFRISNCYGMTETTGSICFTDPAEDVEHATSTIGRPVEPHNFRLWTEGAEVTAHGIPGEIQVRGPWLFGGYFRNPVATREAFVDDEWFRTGDVAEWTEDGSLKLVGRVKEMFKSGGYNVYPSEVEGVLEAHPAVVAAAVIPEADKVYHEVGCAFVMPQAAIDASGLEAWCRERLANYKVPKRFVVEDQLPLLPIGKIDKKALRRRVASAESG